MAWEKQYKSSNTPAPLIHVGDPDEAPGFGLSSLNQLLQPIGVTQWLDLSLLLYLPLYNSLLSKYIFF